MARNDIIIRELRSLHLNPRLLGEAVGIPTQRAARLLHGNLEPELAQIPLLVDLLQQACAWARQVIAEMQAMALTPDQVGQLDAYAAIVQEAERAYDLYRAVWEQGPDVTDTEAWVDTAPLQTDLERVAREAQR